MHSVGRSWLLLTGFILFYIIYLLFGALVFSSIERPVEDKLRHDMEALKQEFLNQSCVNAASLEHFLVKVLTANKYGVSVLRNSSGTSNWDLASSMFFANTLVTTVGESEESFFFSFSEKSHLVAFLRRTQNSPQLTSWKKASNLMQISQ